MDNPAQAPATDSTSIKVDGISSAPAQDAEAAALTGAIARSGAAAVSAETPSSPAASQAADDVTKPLSKENELGPINAPKLTPWALFVIFLGIGCRAFGGPMAQIQSMKQRFIIEEKWVTVKRFNRVMSVYQALPGPEASELACWFGLVSGGRLGALASGLGFILPGGILTVLAAWAYQALLAGSSTFVQAMAVIQVTVCAMVMKAVHKIGGDNIIDHDSKEVIPGLAVCAVVAAIESILNVNFFVTLAHCGLLWGLFLHSKNRWLLAAGVVFALGPLAGFLAYVIVKQQPFTDLIPLGVGVGALGNTPGTQFLVGLLGGLLTFGGAYTAIPFMRYEVVVSGQWITIQQFLDSIAVGQVLPAPLVMFSAFIGFLAGGVLGAFLMALGMFIPAFSFTLIGHEFFERIVESKGVVARVLDGISAGVAGLIAVTAVQLVKSSVLRPTDAVVLMCSLAVLYKNTSKWTPSLLVGAAILVGFIL